MKSHAYPPATLLRRLAAALYDALLLAGLMMVAGALAVLVNGGEAIDNGNPLFRLYLFSVPGLFFLWFWTHGGQTLGMRAWQMRLVADGGGPLSPYQALLRLPLAALAWLSVIGLCWCVFDQRGRALHDIASDSLIVVEPKAQKK
jgi:uncharacterized RDD family membrane protein YckC